jgi:hypothetical protein
LNEGCKAKYDSLLEFWFPIRGVCLAPANELALFKLQKIETQTLATAFAHSRAASSYCIQHSSDFNLRHGKVFPEECSSSAVCYSRQPVPS